MQSLIPNPLHPAVVHLPIALAVLVPLVAIAALVFIRRGARARTAWGISVAALAALLLSGWVSLQTGEQQEERVEDVVAEQAIHGHEEAAELFLMTTAGVLALGLDGDLLLPPNRQFALGVGSLVDLATFRRRRDRVEHAALGDAGLDVLGDQLVAVARNADARVPGLMAMMGPAGGGHVGGCGSAHTGFDSSYGGRPPGQPRRRLATGWVRPRLLEA